MALKLNAVREPYAEFYGSNVEQMPNLVADGRVPMNVAQLMQKRLDIRNTDAKVKSAWMDNYFDTGDAVVYHPDGRIKIVLDSQDLRNMNSDTPRNCGALIVIPKAYEALQGEEFKKGKLGKVNGAMSRAEVKAHPVWKVLARDQGLLNDYTDFIFGEYQARFAKDKSLDDIQLMGIFPGSASGDNANMRAWGVGGLGGGSDACGGYCLVNGSGRFVGIAPEAQVASGRAKDLVQRVDPSRVFSVSQVLEEAGLASDYASNQITKLQNTLEQGGYRITK